MAKYYRMTTNGMSRNTKTITFGGVDLTTPRFSVSESRAIDECNYIWNGSCIAKRNGTCDAFLKIGITHYIPIEIGNGFNTKNEPATTTDGKPSIQGEEARINGLWFIGDTLIIHKGSLIFYINLRRNETKAHLLCNTTSDKGHEILEDGYTYYRTIALPDKILDAHFGNGRLWILTGSEFIVIKANDDSSVELDKVSNIAYVPTTTIGITQNDAKVSGRTGFESVNLLTKWHKNGIVGNVESEDGDSPFVYELDTSIFSKDKKDYLDIKVEIEYGG